MRKAGTAVVVAVTNPGRIYLFVLCLLCSTVPTLAGVLPDDRVDVMYHSYDGGGVEIDGPSVLILKKIGQNVALSGNYYVDSISSASIDVVTTASKYNEDRTEVSVGADYMRGASIMSISYTNSDEDDYESDSASFGVSMDMFGNMTTVTLGFSRSWDTVENNNDKSFSKSVDRWNYRAGISQVLTKDMIMEFNYEAITDEGFLNNPYRTDRYADPTSPIGYSYEPEVYPNTRTSNAFAVRALYYLPYSAATTSAVTALYGEYRFFDDTWHVTAHNIGVGLIHPLDNGWVLEGRYRYYTQDEADFYSDLFPHQDSQNFRSRDKELSKFTSNTIGFTVSYDFVQNGWRAIDRGSINFAYDHIIFDYDDFRDLRKKNDPVGKEPKYDFTADVAQFFISIWF